MQSWLPTIVGMVAGCCSTAAFVPQVLKIRREGDTRAISTRMYVLRDLGFVLWLAYGLALRSTPLVVFNVLSLLLGGTVLVLKLRGKARDGGPGRPRPTASVGAGGLTSGGWWITVLGAAAGLCTVGSFVPQVVKAWREGDTRALSLRMYLALTVGFVLWLGYGLLIGSWPMIAGQRRQPGAERGHPPAQAAGRQGHRSRSRRGGRG